MNFDSIIQGMKKTIRKTVKKSKEDKCGKCFGTGLLSANLHCDACNATGIIKV